MDRTRLITLAHILMTRHGLCDWNLRIGKAKREYGSCDHRTRTITISGPLAAVNSDAQVVDTIRHEIAHALVPGDGHGPAWQEMASAIGANPTRGDAHAVTLPRTFHGRCPGCDRVIGRDRRLRLACGVCCDTHAGGNFDARFLLTWERVA